ncbi:MAG: hypothetical protein WCD07_09530 [Burkholderiales bacterium]
MRLARPPVETLAITLPYCFYLGFTSSVTSLSEPSPMPSTPNVQT